MPLIWADRVRETSSTSGTGAITPTGAFSVAFKTIGSVLASGDTAYFTVVDGAGAWNTFLGTWDGSTVARTTILASSSAGAVSLSGTGVEIWIDAPADWIGTRATLSAAQTFTGAQRGAVTALTSTAASIAINLATNNNFSHTTSENSTLAAPSNPVAGQSGIITITQGATARTLAYNTFWKFAGGTIPTLTATASAVDAFAYYVESATRATCQLIKDVK